MSCRTLQPRLRRHTDTSWGFNGLGEQQRSGGIVPIVRSSGLIAANGQVRATQITGIDDSYSSVSGWVNSWCQAANRLASIRIWFGLGDGWRIN